MTENMPKNPRFEKPKIRPYEEVEDLFDPDLQNNLRRQIRLSGMDDPDVPTSTNPPSLTGNWVRYFSPDDMRTNEDPHQSQNNAEEDKNSDKTLGANSTYKEDENPHDKTLEEEDENLGNALENLFSGKTREAVQSSRSSQLDGSSSFRSLTEETIPVKLEGFSTEQLDSLNNQINILIKQSLNANILPVFNFMSTDETRYGTPISDSETNTCRHSEISTERKAEKSETNQESDHPPTKQMTRIQNRTKDEEKPDNTNKQMLQESKLIQQIQSIKEQVQSKEIPKEIIDGVTFNSRLSYIKRTATVRIGTFGLTEEIVQDILGENPGIDLPDLIKLSMERAKTWDKFSNSFSIKKRIT